ASGNISVALGYRDTASAQGAFATGQDNRSIAENSFSGGLYNIASGNNSAAFGNNNTAASGNEFVVGNYATNYTPVSAGGINGNDRAFNVGVGTSNGSRADGLTLLKNGNVGVSTSTPAEKLHIAGNIRMVDGNQAAGKVMVSDANGTATWQNIAVLNVDTQNLYINGTTLSIGGQNSVSLAALGDNLGNHTASQNIQLNNNWLSNDGGNEGLHIDNSGYTSVGIAPATPHAFLDVTGSASYPPLMVRGGTGAGQIAFSTSGSSNHAHVLKSRHNISTTTGNALDFYVWNPNTDAQGALGTRHVFTIDGAGKGRVGIGTLAPDTTLHVVGAIKMADGNQAAGKIMVSDANGVASWQNAAATVTNNAWGLTGNAGTSTATNFIGTTDAIDWVVKTNNTERARVFASGQLGVGVTATPVATLDVTGNNTGAVALNLRSGNVTLGDTSKQIVFSYNGNSTYRHSIRTRHSSSGSLDGLGYGNAIDFYVWRIGQASSEYGNTRVMTLESNGAGRVGIGTSLPDTTLHVVGAIKMVDGNQATGKIMVSDANGVASWQNAASTVAANGWGLTGNSGTNPATDFAGTTDAVDYVVRTNNAERMRVLSTGNVGIGVTNPAAKLDIGGPVMITNNATNSDLQFNTAARSTIYPNGTNTPTNVNIQLRSKGTGVLELNSDNAGNIQMV
ncbi:MAG TPA: hypothetical protein VK174_00680, partial [Chitinophagales bacterium]|nr:hypothetical protein [Chitinophagales bacterium]